MKTERGIELDLNTSEFVFTCNGLRLYFSSKLYMEKFAREIQNWLDIEKRKLEVKYRCNLMLTPVLIIALYKRIEKRGFKVYDTLRNKEVEENEEFIVYYKA